MLGISRGHHVCTEEDEDEDDEADDDDDDDDDDEDQDDDNDDSTHTKLHAASVLSCTYSKRHRGRNPDVSET